MAKHFEDGVEDVQHALAAGREIRAHGPYGMLIGDEQLNFRPAVIDDPVPTGRQILSAAGITDPLEHLVFFVTLAGLLQEVQPDQTVDLRSAGAERFLVFRNDRSFRLLLNDQTIEWGATRISGLTLKKLAGVDLGTYVVWLDVRGGQDRLIGDTELLDLSSPGVERFYTGLRTITVKVNSRPHQVHAEILTFEEIVQLAFPGAPTTETRVYTVSFKRGPASNPQGTVVENGSVYIKDGMLFNVTPTDKS